MFKESLLALLLCLQSAQAASSFYYVFTADVSNGNFGSVTNAVNTCKTAAAPYNIDNNLVLPFISGSSLITAWEDGRIVADIKTGTTLSPAASFKLGNLVGSSSLLDLNVCASSKSILTGLGSNFAPATNCTGWTNSGNAIPSGRAAVLSCSTPPPSSILSTGTCDLSAYILCFYTGTTGAPSTSPSKTPSRAPITSSPSRNPTTSRPSLNPTTSRPSLSPTTSKPTQSPVRKTLTPTTGAPVDSGGSSTDTSLLAIPIGVGVGGGVLFLIVLAVIFITRSRQRSKREALMMNPGK